MKKIILILVSIVIMCNLFAQKKNEIDQQKLFQKLVLDIGAIPLSKSFGDNPEMTSYNFSLGYQVFKRLDARLNLDILNVFDKEIIEWSTRNAYERLLGLSIGLGYTVLNGKKDNFFKNKSLGFVGKFGAGVDPHSREQESLFFDISSRVHLGKTPYIGLGINHQITDLFMGTDFTCLYLTFGIDF